MHKCSEDHYNLVMKNPNTCPRDTPKMFTGPIESEYNLGFVGFKFVELNVIKSQLKDLSE